MRTLGAIMSNIHCQRVHIMSGNEIFVQLFCILRRIRPPRISLESLNNGFTDLIDRLSCTGRSDRRPRGCLELLLYRFE